MADMKAVVKTEAAPGERYMDWEIPQVGPKDLLVKVNATAVCGTDIHIHQWTPFAQVRVKPPQIIGHEFAGEVVEAGAQVEKFKVGDRIAGETHIPCKQCFFCLTGLEHICKDMAILGVHAHGSFADYILVPEACAWKLPDSISDDIGSVMEPMGVAVHCVDAADCRNKVTVVLGCGPIGLCAVGSAKVFGASTLYAIDISDARLAMAKKLGADVIINAAGEDAVERILEDTHGYGCDVVYELTGAVPAVLSAFKMLRRRGEVVLCGLASENIPIEICDSIIYKEATVRGTTGRTMWGTWFQVSRLIESEAFDVESIITDRFPLPEFAKGIETAAAAQGGKVILYPEG